MMSNIGLTSSNKKYYFDRVCGIVHKLLVKNKILTLFLLLVITPLIIFPVSFYGSDKGALQFSIILTLLLYLIYLSIAFASKDYKKAIIVVFILSFVLKLFISTQLYGTYDMESWEIVAGVLDKDITANFYTETNRYPYAPAWAFVIHFVNQLSHKTSIPFSTLIKVPIIIFDVLIGILLYKLVKHNNKGEKEAFRVVASFLYNPIVIFVTAYGAQFDIIAIYFLLFYYYLTGFTKGNLRHLVYGISIAIKQITVFPIIFFMLLQKRAKKLLFLIMSSIPFIVLISPYFLGAWKDILDNVIGHAGIWGFWGYSRAIQYFTTLFGLYDLQIILEFVIEKIMTIVIFGVLLYYFIKFKKIKMLEAILISYLFFFALAPGFAVQYLVWILPFAVLFKNYFYYVYSLIGSCVAFFFYYGHGTGNLVIREIFAFSIFGPILWIFGIYWLWRVHKEIKVRQHNVT